MVHFPVDAPNSLYSHGNHSSKQHGSKQLYQLTSKTQLQPGAYMAVNGPWDKFGVVQHSTKQDEGSFLNLIRGCEQRKGERPCASF